MVQSYQSVCSLVMLTLLFSPKGQAADLGLGRMRAGYSLAMSTSLAFLAGTMIAPITFAGLRVGTDGKRFCLWTSGGIEDANAVILGGCYLD